jgi:hypothetical protein
MLPGNGGIYAGAPYEELTRGAGVEMCWIGRHETVMSRISGLPPDGSRRTLFITLLYFTTRLVPRKKMERTSEGTFRSGSSSPATDFLLTTIEPGL